MSVESRPNHELLHQPDQFAGLQARFLLSDQSVLSPDKKVSDSALTEITNFEKRAYSPFQTTAELDSKKIWGKMIENKIVDDKFDTKYNLWANNLIDGVNKLSENKRADTFDPIFQKMGINSDRENKSFTDDDAKKIYDRYFSPTDNNPANLSGLKLFVADVLSAYSTAGGQSLDIITKKLQDIKGLAGIFGGKETQEMVAQLILAEAKLKNDPNFIQKLPSNRINNLNDQEKSILNHMVPSQQVEKTSVIDGLPIMDDKARIQKQAKTKPRMLILAETGAGKSVGGPPIIRETLEPGEKLVVTQPQQSNAASIPNAISQILGLKLGQEFGFQHGDGARFDKRKTDTLFVTERIALNKMLNNDPWFKDVRHIMLDEAHKKTIDMEILSGLVLREQKRRERAGEKPLTASFLSATVDKEAYQKYTGVEDVIEVKGRTFGVDTEFSKEPIISKEDTPEQATDKLTKAAAAKASEIAREQGQGDIAIAVAGKGEMKAVLNLLEAQNLANVQIIEMHSGSSKKEKEELEKEAPEGIRRIIIGTNAMETGVTVKGLKHVINTGEKKEEIFDPITGMEYIRKVQQSQAECKQWAGRVGRTSHGYVHHLMTEDQFKQRQEYPTPQIQRSDLTQYVLLLKQADINIFDLDLPSGPPDETRIKAAEQTLQKLGALDAEGNTTKIGKRMAEIPTDFHIARAIVQAEKEKKGIEQMYTIAAIMEASQGKSIMRDPSRVKNKLSTLIDPTSDFVTYMNIWQEFIDNKSDKKWAEENGLNSSALMHVGNNRKKLLERSENRTEDKPASSEELGHYIFLGYQDRLMKRNAEKNSYIWERDNVGDVKMHMGGDSIVGMGNPEYVVSTTNSPITDRDEYETKEYTTYSRGGPKTRTKREKAGTSRNSYISNIQKVKPEWIQ